MKTFRSFLRPQRFFLSIIVFPLLIGKSDCPPIFQLPPPPPATCTTNVPVTMDARKCAVLEPSCPGSQDAWQPGDTLFKLDSAIGQMPFEGADSLAVTIGEVRSGNSLMRRICQGPVGIDVPNGRVLYQYSIGPNVREGTYALTVNHPFALTVSLYDFPSYYLYNAPYDEARRGNQIELLAQVVGAVENSLLYTWRANGVIIQPTPGNQHIIAHTPTQNTEYNITARDFKSGREATNGRVVFVSDDSSNPIPGDPVSAFTISGSSQSPTLNTSPSTGNITRWDWDFNWHGDITEPFDLTINGPNGTTEADYFGQSQGRKYIRLRVTTASGNFHEIFQPHIVGSIE